MTAAGSSSEGAPPAPSPPSPPSTKTEKDLGPLGEELKGRVEEVLERTVEQTTMPDQSLDAVVQDSFERISRTSTIAVARWIAGESMEVAIEAGRETWEIFGELAVHRVASLDEVTWRCFWWRNAMAEVLRESADAARDLARRRLTRRSTSSSSASSSACCGCASASRPSASEPTGS